MADGRKHEDVKVIKNPLLSQSLLLEELSGVSFLVPASPPKNDGIVDYGSKTGVDVPLLGEKKQGSSITQEKGVDKDGPQAAQTFTDIPLNTADLKTPTNDSSVIPSQGSALSKKEADSSLYKSSTSFLSFFLPSVSPTSQNLKPETNPSLDKNERPGPKRLPSPQIYEPQLIPPSSEPIVNSSKSITEFNTAVKPDLPNLLTATPLDLVTPSEQSQKLVSSELPRLPLPPNVSAQNITGLKNPYALRNTQNSVSSFSRLSKSPPTSLGSHDSIPLYSSSNVTNSPPNLFNYLSGPQVTASIISSESFPSGNIINPAEIINNSLNSTSIASESKIFTSNQNNDHESKSTDTAPLSKMFSPQTTPHSPHIYSELLQKSNVLSANFSKVTSQADVYPVQSSAQTLSQAETINPPHIAAQTLHQPDIISPGQIAEDNPQTELNTEISNPELQTNLITAVSGQSVLTGPFNQETFSHQPLVMNSTNENSSTQHSITNITSATQPLSKTFHDSKPKAPYLPPNDDTKTPISSEHVNKSPQEESIKSEVDSFQHHFFETGVSTTDKILAEKSDSFSPSSSNSNSTGQNSLFKTEESHSASVGFQSKQATTDNLPTNVNQHFGTNADISKDMLFNNNVIPQQVVGSSNPPSLSGYFKESSFSNKTAFTESSIHTLSNEPVVTQLPAVTSATQSSVSTFFGQLSTSVGWNQQILKPVGSDVTSENTLQTYDISGNNGSIFQPPAMVPNSGFNTSSQQIFNVQNQPDITKNTPDTPISSIPLHHISISFNNSNYPTQSNAPSLYPQPLYTFPKLNSDSYNYQFQQPGTVSTFPSVPPPSGPIPQMDPAPANPLIPTFNYFSNSQTSCLPPSLDEPVQKPSSKTPSSSYYFKPIQKPDSVPVSCALQTSVPTKIEPMPQVLNPTPSAPPKSFNIPPPNVYYPKESTFKQQTTPNEAVPLFPNTDNQTSLDGEELDQIQLEGSAVPLFNPETVNRKKIVDIPAAGNTFRLSKGLKKPTYAPVPDLGVTERRNYFPPTSPSCLSVSSQEEMAAIHENHNVRTSLSKASESPLVVDNYHGNVEQGIVYRPPYQHWFFKSGRDKKSPWTPFSMADSLILEQVFTSSELHEDTKVATDGGRYDVEIVRRKKHSVYWDETPGEVRRCSWFVKSVSDSRYIPYDENIAALLEDEYKQGCETNEWNRRVDLADEEVIILHGPNAIAHHVRSASPDAWSSQPPLQQKSRVVKRGVEDFDIPKGEPKQVDHLLLVVHGIGKACDLRFRSLVDVVDDFRSISLQLVQSHFHSGVENGMVGRVEVLPVEWHKALHTETIDDRLSAITLPSIPRAREFTNETLLDILFYTSPVFCEKIVQAVGAELNRVYTLYQKRNPGFRGQVSLGAHSLGSLILFDMLCHQQPLQKPQLVPQRASITEEDDEDVDEVGCLMRKAKLSRRMSYLTIGPGTGQPYTIYPQLLFQPKAFFALGSPIGMFITVRGVETLGDDFKFPTCPAFFNIFHPNDPVAYRIEALIKPEMATVPAVLIPHHKGRKRMHLELKETMAHVTAALKQKLVDSMKNTWNAVYQLAMFNRKDHNLQGEVNKVIEDEVMRDASYLESDPPIGVIGEESSGNEVKVGLLNGGRRIDYVLQEAPLETFNQYISAIRSHLVYWESEDTMLLILKEIYGQMGIDPDNQVPQPILPFDISGDNDTYSEYTYSIGALPTQFVRK